MSRLKTLSTLVFDRDGSLSHRKVIAMIFVFYVGWMLWATYSTGNGDLYSDGVWFSIIGGALGISYIRQMYNMKHANDESDKKSNSSNFCNSAD